MDVLHIIFTEFSADEATLAQSVERAAFNRVVGGSSPPSGAFFVE